MNFMEDGTPYYAPYNLKDGSNVRADGIMRRDMDLVSFISHGSVSGQKLNELKC